MKRSFALGLLAASAVVQPLVPVGAQTPATVRIGGGLNDDLTPVLYALRSGIFSRAGLDIQYLSSSIGAALASAVVGGALDIAKSSLMALITGYDHGVRFKLIAGAAVYSSDAPSSQMCVLKTSSITSHADLAGKTVACSSLRGLDQLGIQALVDKAGGNSASVKFVEIPFSAMQAALEGRKADIANIGVPFLAAALDTGRFRTLGDPYAGIANRILIAGWFTTQEYVARNPAVVRRFAEAVREASIYTNAHHAETVALLAEYSHMDPEVIRKMQRGTNATTLNERDIQPAIDLAAKYKYISQAFAARDLLWEGA